MSSDKVGVLVAGSWGTALAAVLARNGHDVRLWSRNREQIRELERSRKNSRFLPDVLLPEGITGTDSMEEALSGARMVVVAAPSSAVRQVARQMAPLISPDTVVVHATKGLEERTLKRMSEVIGEEIPHFGRERIAVLSGPSHAEEVIRGLPTTVVVASRVKSAAEEVQRRLINSDFRVYTHPDVIGVEIGGALKNIIAIGSGLSDGLEFGDNAKAALITRGLAEIARLGVAMGANPMTFAGLAGIGDLIVTCNSRHSRNWRAGNMLARGKSLEEVLEAMGMVVEGVKTTRSARELALQYRVEMPITEQLNQVLFHGKDPGQAVNDLMERGRTEEMGELDSAFSSTWLS